MVGQTISHYRILEKLGQGGMGVVYRAEDMRLGRTVAVKALLPEHARDPLRRKRLEQEARSAAALSAPGIAQVYELEEAGEDLFIIYEFVAGKTLRSVLAAGPLARHVLMRIAIETARALAAAHARGVVHRDLKPENVLQAADGSIKILDFGLARFELPALDGSTRSLGLTEAGTIVGTVAYMSPEQLESKEVDFRSDIFSFGVMIYELATGQHPFKGSSPASTIANILTAEPASMRERDPLVPPELDRIVNKCLRKRPEWRYQSTRDLMVDLENLKYDSDEQRRSSSTLAAAEETSFLHHLSRSFRLSPRRWWELNLLSSYLWYALFIFLAWRVRELSGSAWASVLFFSTVFAMTVLTIMRTILVNFALFNPQELPGQVKRFSPWIRIATMVQGFMLLDMAGEISKTHLALPALLAALGSGAFLVAAFYERMVDSGAFPQAFARHTSSEERLSLAQRGAKQRLGRIMASIQFCFAGLFALGVFGMSRDAARLLSALAAPSQQQTGVPSWVAPMLWAGLVLFVVLTFVWTVTAAEMWRRPLPMARAFRRWFLYFFVPDSIAAFGTAFAGTNFLTGGKLLDNIAFAFFAFIALLTVPMAQLRIAARLAPEECPSTLQNLMPWLRRKLPPEGSNPP
ncbi:MAG: serine/threonine protein kinase [Acidobacteria bacterium]|nr:serine/threonine protein kinase [Acidobacteriota bacterium]